MLWRYPASFVWFVFAYYSVWPVAAVLRKDQRPASSASSAELRRTSDIQLHRRQYAALPGGPLAVATIHRPFRTWESNWSRYVIPDPNFGNPISRCTDANTIPWLQYRI